VPTSEVGIRERILRDITRRLWGIKEDAGFPLSVAVVRRNPESPSHNYPAVHLFEMEDIVVDPDHTGGHSHQRRFQLLLEFWVRVAHKDDASIMVRSLYDAIRWALLCDKGRMGGLCRMLEVQASRIVKPKFGDVLIAGQGVTFDILYVDKIIRP
jgi:hypothetical protein